MLKTIHCITGQPELRCRLKPSHSRLRTTAGFGRKYRSRCSSIHHTLQLSRRWLVEEPTNSDALPLRCFVDDRRAHAVQKVILEPKYWSYCELIDQDYFTIVWSIKFKTEIPVRTYIFPMKLRWKVVKKLNIFNFATLARTGEKDNLFVYNFLIH